MKKRVSKLAIVIALLCIPLGYAMVRDAVVRVAMTTGWLEHQTVTYHYDVHTVYPHGDGPAETSCTVTVQERWRLIDPSYASNCGGDQGSSFSGNATMVPGIFSDEVITLDGEQLWHGEPSEDVTWFIVLLYTTSYLAFLYVLSYVILRRWPAMRANVPRLNGLPLAPMFIGAAAGYVAVLALALFPGDPDPMLGLLFGCLVAAAICVRLGRREPPPIPAG